MESVQFSYLFLSNHTIGSPLSNRSNKNSSLARVVQLPQHWELEFSIPLSLHLLQLVQDVDLHKH